jgi:hypothetical protein
MHRGSDSWWSEQCVLAIDIMDANLKALCYEQWEHAFSSVLPDATHH